MRDFADLVAEADTADVDGWGFGWLAGRATEQRPPWGFSRRPATRLSQVHSGLDIDTGGGEVISEMPVLPVRMCATESWPPNARRAEQRLTARGVEVHQTSGDGPLPFPDESFELVTSRHPVRPNWSEIRRVLVPGGHYFAQHVGPASAIELVEFFLGPLTEPGQARDPKREAAAAGDAALTVTELLTARCRMEFYDVGAIVWILRKCVWWIPDFSVERYQDKLKDLDRHIRQTGSFVAHSTRHLFEAVR